MQNKKLSLWLHILGMESCIFYFFLSLGSLIANSVFCVYKLSLLTKMGTCSDYKGVTRSLPQGSHLFATLPKSNRPCAVLAQTSVGKGGVFLRSTNLEFSASWRLVGLVLSRLPCSSAEAMLGQTQSVISGE